MEECQEVHHECTEDLSYPIHFEEDINEYHLDSCDSHGGCVAANNIKYCPYCGEELVKSHK